MTKPAPPPPADQLYTLNPGPPAWAMTLGLIGWLALFMLLVAALIDGWC